MQMQATCGNLLSVAFFQKKLPSHHHQAVLFTPDCLCSLDSSRVGTNERTYYEILEIP